MNDLLRHTDKARQILPSVRGAAFRVLLGKTTHTLHLPQPVRMEVSPTALSALVKLWGRFPVKEVRPAENLLVWEVTEGVFFPTRTDRRSDLETLYEVFVKNIYGDHFEGKRILDIGAFRGESTLFFLLEGAAEVAALEPSPEGFRTIQEVIRHAPHLKERLRLYPVAIGATEGEQILLVSQDHPAGSQIGNLGEKAEKNTKGFEPASVPVWTFERLLKELGWETIDLAKVDCEGCEYAIFSTTPDSVLRRVKRWVMEFHGGGEPIAQRLRGLGYEVEYQERPDKMGNLRAWLP